MLKIQETEEPKTEVKHWLETISEISAYESENQKNIMRTQFSKDTTPVEQKGYQFPTRSQKRVEKALNKLIDQDHIMKLNKCLDRQFFSSIDQTIKKGSDNQFGTRFQKDHQICQ